MAIATRPIEYEHQGVTLEGMPAWDDSIDEPRPGVLVAHTWLFWPKPPIMRCSTYSAV